MSSSPSSLKDPKAQTDAELAAVKAVLDAMQNVDPASRMRVMRAAEALMPPPPPPQRPGGPPQPHSQDQPPQHK